MDLCPHRDQAERQVRADETGRPGYEDAAAAERLHEFLVSPPHTLAIC